MEEQKTSWNWRKYLLKTTLKKLLTSAAIFVIAVIVGATSVAPEAQATPGALPFGGFILYNVVLPIPCNFLFCPVCPPHIVVVDYSGGVPKTIGLTLDGFSFGPTFQFNNTFTPGVATVGEYIPFPVCLPGVYAIYYPVFPVIHNPTMGLFQMGTAALPGF